MPSVPPTPFFWRVFFAVCTGIFIASMCIPAVFKLQDFAIWGAIFYDNSCIVHLTNEAGHTVVQYPGTSKAAFIWHTPFANADSCMRWSRTLCGGPLRITHARALFRTQMVTADACSHAPRWQ